MPRIPNLDRPALVDQPPPEDSEVLFTREQIHERRTQIAWFVYETYFKDKPKEEQPLLVAPLKGAVNFADTIVGMLVQIDSNLDPELDFIRTRTTEGQTSTVFEVLGGLDPRTVVKDRGVLILEDVEDTSTTRDGLVETFTDMEAAWVHFLAEWSKAATSEEGSKAEHYGEALDQRWVNGAGGLDDGDRLHRRHIGYLAAKKLPVKDV